MQSELKDLIPHYPYRFTVAARRWKDERGTDRWNAKIVEYGSSGYGAIWAAGLTKEEAIQNARDLLVDRLRDYNDRVKRFSIPEGWEVENLLITRSEIGVKS